MAIDGCACAKALDAGRLAFLLAPGPNPPKTMAKSTLPQRPRTVAEAVDRLLEEFDERQKAEVALTFKTALYLLHFSLGSHIRKTFGLWAPDSPLRRDCGRALGRGDLPPDEASDVIVEALWERLQAYRDRNAKT